MHWSGGFSHGPPERHESPHTAADPCAGCQWRAACETICLQARRNTAADGRGARRTDPAAHRHTRSDRCRRTRIRRPHRQRLVLGTRARDIHRRLARNRRVLSQQFQAQLQCCGYRTAHRGAPLARTASGQLRSAARHFGFRQARRALAVLLQAEAAHRARLLHIRGRRDDRACFQSGARSLRRQRRLRDARQAVDVMSESQQFDAIVVGSGITGGWAAKELTEKRLKVLVLERGKDVRHRAGYTTEHMPAWQMPDRGLFEREVYDRDYAIQSRARGFGYATQHFWINDRENPYVQPPGMPFNWLRTDVVGGRSLVWGRHVYRFSDLDFEANKQDGHGVDWPIRYRDIAPWYSHVEKFIGVSGQAEGLAQLPDGEFQPPMSMNVCEQAFKKRVETKYPERRVTIGRVAVLTEPLGDRGACHYCGPCARGCSVGAYFSSQSSTLPAATKTGNLTLRPDSLVE